ncbi:hypothetical protein DICVIV_02850 [Dictyocaulus viviparus]|uniref:DNA/RNA-binding protein Alba-like domain-containing protein n=1 Tax=Dictyocaulus viviparus TaxID=29172 RepID=A0A0D8Y475_DICVI|nr:hypothetical protein DICVIV_02850 [Dictyocaulus viviparus]
MDKYMISEEEEVIDAEPPFDECMKAGVKVMNLQKNTKFAKIIAYVNNLFEDDAVRRVIFRGVGEAAEKCVSCVEVFKRKRQDELYQWNAITVAKRITYWDPMVEGMNRLKVILDTPVIFIMLSRDPYPSELQCMSMQSSSSSASSEFKRPMNNYGNKKKPQNTSSKWSRPSKYAKEAEKAEHCKIFKQLEKL